MKLRMIKTSFSILALACMLCYVRSLDYNDLETMGITCSNMVSCRMIESLSLNFTSRNCECDRACVLFNDCCVDARTRVTARNRRNVPFICLPYGIVDNVGAYVINTCSRDFEGGAEVQRKCQNRNNLSDPLMAAPVTDITTKITYQNRYCAECNDVPIGNLQTWLIQMSCGFTSTFNVSNRFIWDNIQYSSNLNKWGVTIDRNFYTCDVIFERPEYLRSSVRLCRANVISTCPRSYQRNNVKMDCAAYTAIMFANGDRVYRNPHCALCNGLTVGDISCDRGITSRNKKPFSFALLLDVNQSDGDVVGVSRPRGEVCAANQKYDPYFKKCRDLVCALPGYRIVNGKCQKPS